ncbi:hypothetical protein Y032_0025g1139 [Ancylostoma ceylanicum]|uniref:Uncharacterized protein n=1 Tax=Ancylostoma ceylanicum TaxID=53326 RepID=A0A016UUG5_9BILA|nr:hypothetical protein Y032_0025g1139 [Ancylostoma ceylanicum]
MKFGENANFTKKTKAACEMMLIFVISTSNNPFVQNLSEFHEVPYLGVPYRNLTKMGLRCKMNAIFVFSTSSNPRIQSFGENNGACGCADSQRANAQMLRRV